MADISGDLHFDGATRTATIDPRIFYVNFITNWQAVAIV
jgi:hypothetical protein